MCMLQSLQQQQQGKLPYIQLNVKDFVIEAFLPYNYYYERHKHNPMSKAFIPEKRSTTKFFSITPASKKKTVRNPNTNRNILVGGKTYKELMDKGGYMLFGDELIPINTQYLIDSCVIKTIAPRNSLNVIEECSNRTLFHVLNPHTEPINNNDNDISWSNQDSIESFISKNYLFISKEPHVNTVPPRYNQNNTPSISSYFESTNTKICHRLDRDTSGIIILAHTPKAHSTMSQLFQNRQIKKSYVALIHGILKDKNNKKYNVIDLPIGKEFDEKGGYNKWVINGENARNATTYYEVLKQYTDLNYTKVLLHPKTGRGHQLRLHMKAIGHPILGDTLHYDSLHSVYAAPWRLCLHACRLEFVLDKKKCRIVVESPAPF